MKFELIDKSEELAVGHLDGHPVAVEKKKLWHVTSACTIEIKENLWFTDGGEWEKVEPSNHFSHMLYPGFDFSGGSVALDFELISHSKAGRPKMPPKDKIQSKQIGMYAEEWDWVDKQRGPRESRGQFVSKILRERMRKS